MINHELIDKLSALAVMPVIQIENADDAVKLVEVLSENGLAAAEITFRSAAAAESIRRIRNAFPDVILCAGTVLTIAQVDEAVAAGADFIISPGFNPTTVNYCIKNGIKIIPGINNPSQIEQALELGINVVKFFPAEASGGVNMVKALVGPYSQIKLMPTGGIKPSNVLDYLAIPQVIACGGSWLATTSAIADNDWDTIAKNVRDTCQLVQKV
ncbi:bifunctional 4-hydroxy-2-oxoglutarate aldolase/2-dehydro-3-deoxy-phosphogluconate aldolase [Moritella sp.]|uniref:bifunctional 4-hydroxy-2-oxoglutarate aldolase/2-dehydro-3-deoxy-phosphogluconate aldolase n=1 Tax=Moritella sp. TaxID=78556 RepID=UPI001D6E2371|nr:bifunctional 4-hydroxy-2-oxoglutarate aldolase/2-dehydro-3-deoxy-phosphogluconate aldolase [Moritella sp.]MCJ8351151.1 bifunctional 4-hydroxy-2-oxoglutarate aldolase/2-dehydro-3-deoxy-phosphogluconate aldolase [Moritella sp.]NQZ42598.1 bifunctional 4-hydroxy-2-oxoglutarate aldolase/2-dehydro-3-deoxy-phosphogluconate aldolase [Moritella sp.]